MNGPIDFTPQRLRWLLTHVASGPSPTSENRNIAGDSEWGVLKTTAITTSGWDWRHHKILPQQYWGLKDAEVRVGDVIVTKAGPRHRVGVPAYVDQVPAHLVVSGKMLLLRPNPGDVDARFLAWALSTPGPQSYLDARKTGMAESQMNFANDDLLGMPIALPHLEEQRRIADFLDAEISQLGYLTSRRTRQRSILTERATAAVSETLIPGILTAPLGVGPYPWLPAIEGIPLVRVGYISRLKPGISPSALPKDSVRRVERPLLQIGNVQAGRLKLDKVGTVLIDPSLAQRTALRAGDILTTRVGDPDKLGRAAVWRNQIEDCLFESNIFALQPDMQKVNPAYLAMMTQTVHGRCYFESTGFKTTGLASTNTGKVLGFSIPLPGRRRQDELVREVDQICDALDSLSALIDRQLSAITQRRQGLITAAVTGQFDVSTASGRNVTEGVSA